MSTRPKAFLIGAAVASLTHGAVALWVRRIYDELPEQVVTHWGPDGPDGFSDRGDIWWLLLTGLAVTLATGGLLTAVVPARGGGTRIIAGFTSGLAVFLAGLMGGTTILQAGSSPVDPLDVHPVWLIPLVLAALVAGLLAARLVGPEPPRPAATGVPPRSARLAEGDARRSWGATLSTSPGFLFILLLPAPAFVVLVIALQDWVVPLVLTVLVALPLLSMWKWDLRADASGLTCRSVLGWPRLHLPLREIESAEALRRVESMEFGGPGLRMTKEGSRLALRSGPALRLVLSDGTDFIVTTPDAEVVAATLNSVIADERDPHP